MVLREETLVRGKARALLRETVGSRIEFAGVVSADLGKEGPRSGLGAGQEAVEDGSDNVMTFGAANVWGENTLTAPPAQEMYRAEGVREDSQVLSSRCLLKSVVDTPELCSH
jgi:hypothetical protein